ncbi:MAG: hypothetical protein IKV85_01405 [Ruminococcus sp.]|nr:hypothetical protein [Ruminococcus sp.]
MKVEKADYAWAVLSFIAVGVTYHFGYLLYGLLGIYAAMVILFMYHIRKINKRIENTEAAYGEITGYYTEKTVKEYYYPVVEYETAENELISAVYAYPDNKKRYEIGDKELIRYTPDDSMFFYFESRENELTEIYYRSIIAGGVAAAVVAIIIIVYNLI